jgi:hypothetical protein
MVEAFLCALVLACSLAGAPYLAYLRAGFRTRIKATKFGFRCIEG